MTLRVALAAAALALGLGCGTRSQEATVTLRFWAMGREGEVVSELVRDFEREHPGVRVVVQQIPWSAAHEKLLTAYVGGSTPDIAQLGNTWIAEFVALRAIESLQERVDGSSTVRAAGYFEGIWDTNVIDGLCFGIPWYVDTRVIFYRKDALARAGYREIPRTWEDWRAAMVAIQRQTEAKDYAIFLPINEYTQPVIFGLQAGSPLLRDDRGAFSEPEFRRAFDFYLSLFRDGLAPPATNNDVANVYQEFARGYFSMYVTGPWNLGEFARRLPEELQSAWATAPLPGPSGAESGVSLAGGSSLVLFRGSEHKPEAWALIEFLSRPEQQLRFYRLTGDLPARLEAWEDSSLLADERIRAFGVQLQRVRSTPKVPEWELIANRLLEASEVAIRGRQPVDSVLTRLDADVDRILEKRRWLRERERSDPLAAVSDAGRK